MIKKGANITIMRPLASVQLRMLRDLVLMSQRVGCSGAPPRSPHVLVYRRAKEPQRVGVGADAKLQLSVLDATLEALNAPAAHPSACWSSFHHSHIFLLFVCISVTVLLLLLV